MIDNRPADRDVSRALFAMSPSWLILRESSGRVRLVRKKERKMMKALFFVLILLASVLVRAQDACTLRLREPSKATVYFSNACYVEPISTPAGFYDVVVLETPELLWTTSDSNWQELGAGRDYVTVGDVPYFGVFVNETDSTYVFNSTDRLFSNSFDQLDPAADRDVR